MSMAKQSMKKFVQEGFSDEYTQEYYTELVKEGLWVGEKYFINKYFRNKNGKLLDIGCGTGRTTTPLFKMGYDVTAVDITPKMIENAKKIAKKKSLDINYKIGDATSLEFDDNSFDYILFSNQGWTQIPNRKERAKALKEIKRVLKKGGTFIFTAHPRSWTNPDFFWFWVKQWLRFYILKPLGFDVREIDFGDRFFERESIDGKKTDSYQFIHISKVSEVIREISNSGLELVEVDESKPIHKTDTNRYPPVFYICTK